MGVFGAELFVVEGGGEAEAGEDFCERGSVGDVGLGFDASFVDAGQVFVVRVALVSDDVASAVVAETEEFTPGFEVAGRSVVEGVVFEGAGGVDAEAGVAELAFQVTEVLDG